MPLHDPDSVSSNPSDSGALRDIVAARLTRRSVLAGGLGAAAATFLSTNALAAPARASRRLAGSSVPSSTPPASTPAGSLPEAAASGLLGFAAVAAGTDDAVVVPDGYTATVFVPWGTPLQSNGPAWKPDGSNTAADQDLQVGSHHDGMFFFPIGEGDEANTHGLLVINHEYVDSVFAFTDGGAELTAEKVAKSIAGHGVSVLEVQAVDGEWQVVDSSLNRRITGATPVTFSGPATLEAVGLQSNNDPMGTLNNCGSGRTLWSTYLTCEENFNGYFGTVIAEDAEEPWEPSDEQARYGLAAEDAGYGWYALDPRFDLAVNPNEANRFGWVVEIDPADPESVPVKRTALGRFKHETADVVDADGRIVVYMGDDQDGEYVYKFVGTNAWQDELDAGNSPLDDGILYVARFHDDGTGEWLPLMFGKGPLDQNGGFVDQADVLIRTREAADKVGATKLDRPEWISTSPVTGETFAAFTNGSQGVNPINPRNPDPYGHIVRWVEADKTATTFDWDIFLLAGDPAYDDQVTLDDSNIFGSPDGLWADPRGILWIQTDISNSSQVLAERGYDNIGNNQMLATDTATGEVRRFLVGPRGCEVTGVDLTPDGTTMFVNIQHPGESTPAWGEATADAPTAVSSWPDGSGRPRSATLIIRKDDGGLIGS